jgi:hypothetical protein
MGRLKVLAVTAGFFLILKVPAFAQYTAPAPSALASSDNDQSNVSVDSDQPQTSVVDDQSQSSAANDQGEGLADTDWWWENEGLTSATLVMGRGRAGPRRRRIAHGSHIPCGGPAATSTPGFPLDRWRGLQINPAGATATAIAIDPNILCG